MKHFSIIIAAFAAIAGLFPAQRAFAQRQKVPNYEKVYTIRLDYRVYGDSVVLRWMPDDPAVWMLANYDGWRITRTGGKSSDRSANFSYTVKPWDVARMESAFGHSDMQAGALAQAIHGESRVSRSLSTNAATMVEYVCRLRSEQQSRQAVVSLLASRSPRYADAAGLRFVDRNVDAAATYEYTVSFAGTSDIFSCEEASCIVKPSAKKHKPTPIAEVKARQVDAARVAVSWSPSDYCGFYVERSLNKAADSEKSAKWQSLNSVPVINAGSHATTDYPGVPVSRDEVLFIDTLETGQSATYRVRGYDLFGDLSEWQTSPSVTMSEQRPLAAPELLQVVPNDSNTCTIEWRLPSNNIYSGFAVAFAKSADNAWTKVSGKIDASVSYFADSNAASRGTGYYRLYAYDSLGRLACSNIMPNPSSSKSSIAAPQVPRGKSSLAKTQAVTNADVQRRAVVNLVWNEPKKKPDNLLGFRVFFSHEKDGSFTEASSRIVTGYSFNDTLNIDGSSPDAYYYVMAVDNRYNESPSSDTVHVALPDVLAPDPCEWKSTTPGETKTAIKWHRSKSTDVVRYNIYSQTAGSANWQWVKSLDSSDYGVSPFVTYNVPSDAQVFPVQYCIEAVDASGNSSSRSGIVSLPANAKADAGITLKAKYNRKAASVSLNWQYAAKPDAKFVGIIYRTVEGEAPVAVGAFNPSQTDFTDSRLPNAKNVSYHIVLKSSQSSASRPSAPVKVTIK